VRLPQETTVCFSRLFSLKVHTGAPWRDLPDGFGPWNRPFRRFRRWAASGVVQRLFETISGDPDLEVVLIDGAIVPVHQKTVIETRILNQGTGGKLSLRWLEALVRLMGRGKRGKGNLAAACC